MKADKVRIGLVGCGAYARTHLQGYRATPAADVTAVFDVDQARARQMAAEFGVPRVCASLDELCALPDLDAVDVLTPEGAHLDPVLAAVRAGKHVLVEKPLATDLDHCTRMIAAARQAERILMVGHVVRFETKYARLKEEVASGRLGKVVSMHARRNRPRGLLPIYGRSHPAIENSIHDIDMMLWFTGQAVRKVRGYGRNVTGGKHHDTFWGVLEFEGGALGVVETIWLLPDAGGITLDDEMQVIGDKGVGHLQFSPGPLTFWRDDGFHVPDVSYDAPLGGMAVGAVQRELAYFCDCVQAGRAPEIITAIEARRAVRVALALVASAEADAEVVMKEWD